MTFLSNPYFMMVRKSWHYARGYRRQFVLFYALFILSNVAQLLIPYVLGRVFNTLQTGGPHMLVDLTWWLAAYPGLYLVFWALHGPARVIERRVAFKAKEQCVDDMYHKVKELPMKWHHDHHSGNTINRINKSAAALYSFSEAQFVYIAFLMTFFGPIVALSVISPKIACMAFFLSLAVIFLLSRFDRAIIPLLEKENDLEHHFSSAFFDYVSNMTTIISLRIGERTRSELRDRLGSIFPFLSRSMVLNEYKWFVMGISAVSIEAAVILYYVWSQVHIGAAVMIGTAVTIQQYMRNLSNTFSGFAAHYENIIRWRTNCGATRFIENAYEALPAKQDTNVHENWQHISIRHLRFSYEDREHNKHQLQDISLDIKRGQRIALVGESGSGKSTLLGLLRGVYQAEGAEVQVDESQREGLAALASLTTLIPQEPEMFENTVRYNITTGIPCSEANLEEAMRISCFDSVVKRFPQGVETDIREKGVNMSGGEKQRLALARGVFAARESSLLLLDEPTSSVDSQNERRIYANIFKAFAGYAIVSSVHRLHLLPEFDWVYVMHDGRIVEQGTFSELLARKERFFIYWQNYNSNIA